MPVAKLGQLSTNELNDVSQKHFDVDMRLRDMLTLMSLDQKIRLINRLPGIIDEIKMQIDAETMQA